MTGATWVATDPLPRHPHFSSFSVYAGTSGRLGQNPVQSLVRRRVQVPEGTPTRRVDSDTFRFPVLRSPSDSPCHSAGATGPNPWTPSTGHSTTTKVTTVHLSQKGSRLSVRITLPEPTHLGPSPHVWVHLRWTWDPVHCPWTEVWRCSVREGGVFSNGLLRCCVLQVGTKFLLCLFFCWRSLISRTPSTHRRFGPR